MTKEEMENEARDALEELDDPFGFQDEIMWN